MVCGIKNQAVCPECSTPVDVVAAPAEHYEGDDHHWDGHDLHVSDVVIADHRIGVGDSHCLGGGTTPVDVFPA